MTDIGLNFMLDCESDGNLEDLSEWPQCRDAAVCTNIPVPPENSKLKNTEDTSAKEFHFANYSCKSDGKFNNDQTVFQVKIQFSLFLPFEINKMNVKVAKIQLKSMKMKSCA